MIKYYFSDIDGTLIHSDGTIGKRTQQAIQACGVPFSLVSARAPFEMAALIDTLQLSGLQIAYNGAMIFQGSQPIIAYPLAVPTLSAILKAYQKHFQRDQVYCALYGAHTWYAAAPDPSTREQVAMTGIAPQYRPLTQITEPIFKVMFYCADHATLQQLTAYYQVAKIPGYQAARSGDYWLELTSNQANKASAIATVLAASQLSADEVAAFGDSENDLPMFQMVGQAIAMGNAPDLIQQHSDVVTSTNDEDGIADFLASCPQEEFNG